MAQNDTLEASVITLFGAPGPLVNAFGIMKQKPGSGGGWERCSIANELGHKVKVWPLEQLTPEWVTDNFGYGTFRCSWFGLNPEAVDARERTKALGHGCHVELVEPARTVHHVAPVAPAAQPAPLSNLPGMSEAMALLSFADQRSAKSLESIISMASILSRGGNQDSATMMQMILDRQTEQFRTLVERSDQQMAAMRAEISSLRAELDGDDDEGGGSVGSVARAAAPLFRPGKPIGDGLKAALANYVAENPDQVVGLIKEVPALLKAVSKVAAELQPQPPAAPPAPPVAAPKPRPRVVEPPPQPGLNALLAAKPEAKESAAE